ncbi:conserved membrane hypothetical protein [Weissella viridescens]|nr:hypothetical protein [Weissella viridescens]MCB6840686.1 hypothetical protein [Weissella viridescens]MCB6847419.1 hypothetical protein [Weissella viridescens]QOD85857.1 hypothetical protein IE337_06630 [Weissella viridescens]WJI90975.1 hypothetical protein PWA48_06610 [Weissella viridescens]SOB43909.1 conserved membrane hypothetical protein [Weissella viridescens]
MKGHLIFLTMVTSMVTINTFLMYGINAEDVTFILEMLLFVIPGAFILKEFFTIPLVKNIERRYLGRIKANFREFLIIPALIILINSGVITLVTTILKNIGEFPILTNFLQGWGIKLSIIFPLFFLVVRPTWNYIFTLFESEKIKQN